MNPPLTDEEARKLRRYDRIYRILAFILCPAFRRFINFHGEPLPQVEGPMLILCNHNTDFDFILLAGAFTGTMDFVVTESLMRMGFWGHLVAEHLRPILHDKGSVGVGTVRQIVKRLRAGRNVTLFPEGNRSFDGITCAIPSATGGLARISGATLVLYRLTGGYFTSPRWGKGLRHGRMEGHVTGVYSPQELKGMTSEQVQTLIEEGLYEDAYKEQENKPVRFQTRRGARLLETLLFSCPGCGKISSLHSDNNRVGCECGYELSYTSYGYLEDPEGRSYTVTEMLKRQKERLKQMLESEERAPDENSDENKDIRSDENTGGQALWSDSVSFRLLDSAHNILEEKSVTLAAYRQYLMLGDYRFNLEDVSDISIVQRNRLGLHIRNMKEHYEITGADTFNAIKYQIWKEIRNEEK